MKRFFTVRKTLCYLLCLSVLYTAYSAYYKIKFWDFGIKPNKTTEVFVIDAHIAFRSYGEDVKVSFATPSVSKDFKILNEDVSAKNYAVSKDKETVNIRNREFDNIQEWLNPNE